MVYKDSKYASFGGHTVRGRRNDHAKYRRSAFIVRKAVSYWRWQDAPQSIMSKDISDGLNMPNGVYFSLNKQNRWELPDVIEDVIKEGDEEFVNIRYVQRHNCNRTNSSVRVAATDGVIRQCQWKANVKVKSRGYFQPDSVFCNKLLYCKKRNPFRSFRKRIQRKKFKEYRDPDDTRPQISYEVVTPVPGPSYFSHQSASSMVNDFKKQLPHSLLANGNVKNKGHRHRSSNHVSVKDELELISLINEDEVLASDEDDYEKYIDDGNYDNHERFPEFPTEKSSVFGGNMTENVSCNLDNCTRVILQIKDTKETSLRQSFGQSYIECQCIPRKFIISMSDKIQEIVSQVYGLSMKSRETAYLLFVHDVTNDVNTEEQPVYRLSLQCPYVESNGVIETLFDYMHASVEEIVGNTEFYLETLPIETYKEERLTNSQSKQLETALGWDTESILLENAFYLDSFLSCDNDENSDLISSFEIVSIGSATSSCRICFLEINSVSPGTALKLCGHTFCNGCWKEYVTTNIDSSRCHLMCPEFECKAEVDAGAIASFLNYDDVVRFARVCYDKHVAKRKDKLYCPNSKCRYVLRINKSESVIAHCRCGTKVCVKCTGNAHWPADCDAVKDYHSMLLKTGDMNLTKNTVYSCLYIYGKNCPECNVFVQKFGGCNQVRCWCGKAFCWGCGKLSNECETKDVCSRVGVRDRHDTEKVRLTSFDLTDGKERNPFYKIAVQHRLNQNPTKVYKMLCATKATKRELYRHFSSLMSNNSDCLDFEHGSEMYKTEAEKISDYINNTVDLYMELNQTIEHSAVLLWSHGVLDDDGLVLAEQLDVLAKEPERLFQLLLACGSYNYSAAMIIDKLKKARCRIISCLRSFIDMSKVLDL